MAGYYTEIERKQRLESNIHSSGIWFESCVDLSEPVKIHGYKSRKEKGLANELDLASAVGSFMTDWALNFRPRLNGFQGTDCVRWEIVD